LDNVEGKNIEQWILKDVVETVKDHYKIAGKARIYITGLSMGGWGALRLAARFGKDGEIVAAAGMSSMTDISDLQPMLSYNVSFYGAPESPHILDCIKANRSAMPPFRFDVGKTDPFIAQNRSLHEELTKLGIEHVYEEFEGGHNGLYWTEHIADALNFFEKIRSKLNHK